MPICLHSDGNTNILKWNERLKIAVDAAHGNVHFISSMSLDSFKESWCNSKVVIT